MTQNDYIAMLERDLLELPGEPYGKCAVCGQVHNTCSMQAKYYLMAKFWCCDGECSRQGDELCEAYYSDRVLAY